MSDDRGMKHPTDDASTPAPEYTAVIPAEQLLQDERPSLATVPVRVTTPVQVREMPSRNAAGRTALVSNTAAVRLLTPDPRRKRATLYAFDQEIAFGPTQASATSRWPKQVPLYLDTRDEVWVISATSTTDVTIITEAWAQ